MIFTILWLLSGLIIGIVYILYEINKNNIIDITVMDLVMYLILLILFSFGGLGSIFGVIFGGILAKNSDKVIIKRKGK